ncbi:MAG: 4'-phosphopantetheinyl transferase superfamily protein [Acidimicrobiia bacterium]
MRALEAAGSSVRVWYLPGAAQPASLQKGADLRHAAIAAVLASALDPNSDDTVIDHRCASCGGSDHGQPTLRGRGELAVSIARGGGDLVVALAESPVGIDMEPPNSADAVLEVAPRIMTDVEWRSLEVLPAADRARRALVLWTAKEAALKAAGTGLPGGLANVECEVVEGRLVAVRLLGPLRHLQREQWRARTTTGCRGVVTTVVLGQGPPRRGDWR